MADAKRDANRVTAFLGITNDSDETLTMGRFDPVTLRFLVNTTVTGLVDTSLADGVDSDIKATVFDYTSSNPLAVRLTDTSGNYVPAGMDGSNYANNSNYVSGVITSAMTGTTSTSLVSAPGVGLRNYITTIVVSNSHATVGTDVLIQDGSGGTTLAVIPAASSFGGAVVVFPTPLKQPTTNTALYCANVTTGSSTKVSAFGYKAA